MFIEFGMALKLSVTRYKQKTDYQLAEYLILVFKSKFVASFVGTIVTIIFI